MTPDEIKARAANAAQLLDNRLLKESLDGIEAEILATWEACPARDTDGREELWKTYKIAKKFRAILQGMVESGKVVIQREKAENPFMKQVRTLSRTNRR